MSHQTTSPLQEEDDDIICSVCHSSYQCPDGSYIICPVCHSSSQCPDGISFAGFVIVVLNALMVGIFAILGTTKSVPTYRLVNMMTESGIVLIVCNLIVHIAC